MEKGIGRTKLVYNYHLFNLASFKTSLNYLYLLLLLLLYVNVHERDELVFSLRHVGRTQPQLQVFCSRLNQHRAEEGGTLAAGAVAAAALPVPKKVFRHFFVREGPSPKPGVAVVVATDKRRDAVAPLLVPVGARTGVYIMCVVFGLAASERPAMLPRAGTAVSQRHTGDVGFLNRSPTEHSVIEGLGGAFLVGLNLTADPSVRAVVDGESDGITASAEKGCAGLERLRCAALSHSKLLSPPQGHRCC